MRWFVELDSGICINKDRDHCYLGLDRKTIRYLGLTDDADKQLVRIEVQKGDVPFYRCRTRIKGSNVSRFYMVGTLDSDRKLKGLVVVHEDGSLEHFTEFNMRPELFEPEWFAEETV